MKIRALLFFILMTSWSIVLAQHISVDSLGSGKQVNRYFSFFVDTSRQYNDTTLPYENRMHQASSNGILNFGYTDHQVWLKIDVYASAPQVLIVEVNPLYTDSLRLFCVVDGTTTFMSEYTGTSFRKENSFPYLDPHTCNYTIPVTLSKGVTTLLLKSNSRYTAKRMSIKVWKKAEFMDRKISFTERISTRYILLGVILFAIVIVLIIGVFVRQIIFVLYPFFLLSNIVNVFSVKGWIYPYLDYFNFYPYDLRGLFNGVLLINSLLYFYFLIPKQFSNYWLRSGLMLAFVINVLLLLITVVVPDSPILYQWLIYVFKSILFMASFLIIGHFYSAAKKGYALAWVYLVSFIPLTLNTLLHFLHIFTIVGVFHSSYLWEFAVFFELLVYTIALIYRYTQVLEERERTAFLLEQNRQQYVNNLYKMQELERIRFARDLHDSIGQKLAVAKMYLPENGSENAGRFIDEAISEVRVISHNLIPEELNFGLKKAIEELADRIKQHGHLEVSLSLEEIQLSRSIELAVFRIVQEVTSNMVKHAQATKMEIVLFNEGHSISLVMKDNGKGFDVTMLEKNSGIGWQNVIARAKILNGQVDITSDPKSGTTVKLIIPL